jgi:hypothetical protein
MLMVRAELKHGLVELGAEQGAEQARLFKG